MEKKWTARDIVFTVIGLSLVVLLIVQLMAMTQADRQYDRLNTVLRKLDDTQDKFQRQADELADRIDEIMAYFE